MMISQGVPVATARRCLICQAPLAFSPTPREPLCGRAGCHWHYTLLRQQHKLCKICARPLTEKELPAKVCAAPECQRAACAEIMRRDREQREAQREVLRQQATRLFEQVATSFAIGDPPSFPLAVVPAYTAEITRLPRKRRSEFRAYLLWLIRQVLAFPDSATTATAANTNTNTNANAPDSARTPQVLAALGKGCACCKGSCCQGGAFSHAYLTTERIRRYMAAHPQRSPRQVLADYMGFIGDRTFDQSCVYHQADGCSLPRAMRADICNLFLCGGLLELEQKLSATAPRRAFIVAADHAIQRAALLHEEQMLMIPAPPPAD